jgi:hypothetical protein
LVVGIIAIFLVLIGSYFHYIHGEDTQVFKLGEESPSSRFNSSV